MCVSGGASHRSKLGELQGIKNKLFNATVSRPEGRQEYFTNPKARVWMKGEYGGLNKQEVFDSSTVSEYDEWPSRSCTETG